MSPKAITFSCRARNHNTKMPMTIGPMANCTCSHRRYSKPPIIQNKNSRKRYSLKKVNTPDVKAPKNMLTATPAKSKDDVSIRLPLTANKIMPQTAIQAPTKAKSGMYKAPAADKPVPMAMTAPKEAPAETPIIPGSAKGLAKTPCITVPATARPAPTSMATNNRGSRIYQNTAC